MPERSRHHGVAGEPAGRVVIVGGGVIGLSIAFEVARRGRRVLVLERDRGGSGSTWASAGMLAPVSEAETQAPALRAFALDSMARYPAFVADVEAASGRSCRYRGDGTLWVAVTRDDLLAIEHLARTLDELRLPAEPLDAAEVLALEPHLTPRVLGGLRVAADGQVDPRALADALVEAVRGLGGEVRTGVTVTEIVERAGHVCAVHGHVAGDEPLVLASETVVLAAGAWSTERIRSPLAHLGVRPVKGQLLRLRGPGLARHVLRHPDVYLVPRAGGELLVGATMEEVGFEASPTAGAVLDLLRHAWRVLPGLYDLELAEVSVGFRPAVRDDLPVIGASAVEGLFVAVGHLRNGVLLAPATAVALADAIVIGEVPAVLAPFAAARLAHDAAVGTGDGGRQSMVRL